MMTLLTLTAAQAAVVANALADAEWYRRDFARTWCAGCAAAPDGACPAHLAYAGRADAYRQLRDAIARAIPQPRKNGRLRCSEHRGRPESAKP